MSDSVEEILRELNLVLGVVGSFVCSNEGDSLGSVPSRFFDRRALDRVGHLAIQTISGLCTARSVRTVVLDFRYVNWQVIIQAFRQGCLCIVCLPDVNRPLMRMAAEQSVKQLSAVVR